MNLVLPHNAIVEWKHIVVVIRCDLREACELYRIEMFFDCQLISLNASL